MSSTENQSELIEKICKATRMDDIKECINCGLSPECTVDKYMTTPFIHHCAKGNTDIVKYLVEVCNVNIEKYNVYGNTGFGMVCEYGHMDLFDYLVSRGVNFITKNFKCRTPLMNASYYNQLEIVRKLLPLMTLEQINYTDINGYNAVYSAVFGSAVFGYGMTILKYLDILKHLTIEGCNLDHEDNYGNTPLSLAQQNGLAEIAEYLSDYVE